MEHFDWVSGFWFPYINFVIFAVGVGYLARKPLRGLANSRRNEYKEMLDSARAAQVQAKEQLALVTERMKTLDQELARIKEESKKEAEAEAERIISAGEELAAHILKEAGRVADGEVAKAKSLIQQQVFESMRASVEQKLLNEVSKEQHAGLVEQSLMKLPQLKEGAH